MHTNTAECEASGLDEKEVERIARGLSRYAKEASKLGLHIFGGAGGELRYDDKSGLPPLKVAYLDGSFDGGCGASVDHGDGLERGE